MWFLFVGVGLALVIASGLYVRRRLGDALLYFGVRARRVRILRWLIAWLLFGFPIIMVVSVVVSLLLGRDTLPRYDGVVAAWLLGVPFAWAVLVVLQSVLWVIAIDLVYLAVRHRRGITSATRMRAFAVLGVVAVFAIYTPARIVADRGDLRVRHHPIGAVSPTTPPFRIAFIADIQQDVHTDGDRAREVYRIVNAAQPDVVLSAGDWINAGPDHIAATAAAASTLTSRRGTFSVRGDHEHFAYVDRDRSVAEVERAMRAAGISMLNNEVRWFDHHGKRIAVVFVNYNYIFRSDRATIDRLVASAAGADYTIVVTHQLDRKLTAQLADKVDLVLAGHTHGGQLNPVVGITHVALARIETELVDGRYQLGRTTVIVTAGVGYSLVPIRYASPGSIEILELRL